jgi:hypothetical protein
MRENNKTPVLYLPERLVLQRMVPAEKVIIA